MGEWRSRIIFKNEKVPSGGVGLFLKMKKFHVGYVNSERAAIGAQIELNAVTPLPSNVIRALVFASPSQRNQFSN